MYTVLSDSSARSKLILLVFPSWQLEYILLYAESMEHFWSLPLSAAASFTSHTRSTHGLIPSGSRLSTFQSPSGFSSSEG